MTEQAATTTPPQADQAEVRWLTAEQQAQWRAFRDGNALLNDALARELDSDSGLSLGEYEVLVRLSEAPGRTMRMSELADGLAHSRSRLTHTIRRMEAAGLVERTACREDARGVNATMTEAGWQRLVAAAPGHVRAVREHLVDVLTADQLRALGSAMQAVTDALRGSPAA
ncbi:MarR family winged helix-turn-helix transcriptional regulator [Cellulomonas timonensis]|uniref:MarR family winged helix-turn-helix transcriptional regulator n=1 Tax=Cellulomonas timonensis TaxID=1689271 RepID=UPI00083382DC|nr:MarR family transcriptional regulator [Cellulomonas timonensis]